MELLVGPRVIVIDLVFRSIHHTRRLLDTRRIRRRLAARLGIIHLAALKHPAKRGAVAQLPQRNSLLDNGLCCSPVSRCSQPCATRPVGSFVPQDQIGAPSPRLETSYPISAMGAANGQPTGRRPWLFLFKRWSHCSVFVRSCTCLAPPPRLCSAGRGATSVGD